MKPCSSYFVLVIFFFSKVILVHSNLENNKTVNYQDDESPLFLTTFIETGRVLEAKDKARVYLPELPSIESYAGYLTVDKEYNSNLFFWFFPSQTNPKSDPVVLWLQGGPGASSLFGLFTGNGPIAVSKNNTLESRKYSWNIDHNVIYIDSPVGVGFSFTENELGYATNEEVIAVNLYKALTQFFDLFPELLSNEFFVTGESYAGKYVPALGREIRNRNVQAKKKINLAGLAIGNGWTDPINQIDFSDNLYQIGLIDDQGRQTLKHAESRIKDFLKKEQYLEATTALGCTLLGYCENSNSTLFQNLTGFSSYYNYRYQAQPEEFKRYTVWLQQPAARKAVHVGNNNFSSQSSTVFNYMRIANCQSKAPVLADLLQHYRVLIYTGQLDIVCAYPLVVNYLRHLKWPGAEEYKTAVRKQWWIEDDLAGYTKSVQNLTEVLIRNAGHMAPSDQTFWTWKMISHFTRHKDF